MKAWPALAGIVILAGCSKSNDIPPKLAFRGPEVTIDVRPATGRAERFTRVKAAPAPQVHAIQTIAETGAAESGVARTDPPKPEIGSVQEPKPKPKKRAKPKPKPEPVHEKPKPQEDKLPPDEDFFPDGRHGHGGDHGNGDHDHGDRDDGGFGLYPAGGGL